MPRHTSAAEEQSDLAPRIATEPEQDPPAPASYDPAAGGASPRVLIGAIIVSAGLHAAAAAAMLAGAALPEYGVLATKSDALSLETTQTIVLESMSSTPLQADAAAAAAMPQGSVPSSDADPEPLAAVDPVPAKESPVRRVVTAREVVPEAVVADAEPLEVIAGSGPPDANLEVEPQRREAKEDDEAERRARTKKRREEAKRRKKRQTAGGPSARTRASGKTSGGRVSASRGSVISYAARVRAKVARNKPSSAGHRGVARVSFGVSRSGGLSYARLSRSSGSSALDRAALRAVQRAAPFGAPPPGASPAQLRFSIPFYFR